VVTQDDLEPRTVRSVLGLSGLAIQSTPLLSVELDMNTRSAQLRGGLPILADGGGLPSLSLSYDIWRVEHPESRPVI
jgi:hypothetical protein